MSEVATKNLTFWETTDYKYPGFGQTAQISDGLGGTIGITYNQIDYDDRAWRGKPDGDSPITEDRLLSGEIENKFSLTGQVKGITVTMPQIRTIGRENNYSVTLDFSNYKASLTGSKVTDGATCGDTYLAISRFFNGSKAGYTTIKVTATTLDGSPVNLADWKLFNSGTLGQGHNARVFLDAATQTISGKNSQGKQEFCPTPPNPGTSFGTDTGLGLFQLPSDQRYTSITLTFKQKKIKGAIPNDLHNIYVASNTSSTSSISETPETKPMDINTGLQLHLPLNEIVENSAKEKEVVDVSPAKFKGKVNGNPEIVPDSRFGNCINFDGVDDYIELPTATIPETGEITISFWANGGKSLPNKNSIILAVDKSNHRVVNIHLPWSNSNVYFDCGNTTTSDDSSDRIYKIAESADFKDKWTYWVFTKNVATGEMNIYLNGVLWQSGTGKERPLTSITTVKFGSAYGFYDGKVAHLRIYDRVLSPEEINECMKVDATPPPMNINSGLQLHLPLNEIVENAESEKEVVDVSAGKLNGKVHGATVVADDRFGNCINFNGVDDYIELPEMNIDYSQGFTLGVWVNYQSFKYWSRIIDFAIGHKNNNIFLFNQRRTNYLSLGVYTSIAQATTPTARLEATAIPEVNQWLYLTATIDKSGNAKIYKDGQEVCSGFVGVPSSINRTKNYIAKSLAPAAKCFHGQMLNLRVYNRPLSPEEINECMKVDGTPPPMDINSGLQLHLPLNEIVENAESEKEVVDVSPAKLNGKVHSATVVADSQLGSCLNFDGVDDHIQLPEMNVDYSKGFTVGAWVYYESFKIWSRIIDFGIEARNENILLSNISTTASVAFHHYPGTTNHPIDADGILEQKKWLYLAATIDESGNGKIYMNGEEVASGSSSIPNNVNRTKNYIGKSNVPTDEYFHGKMINLRVYNRGLSKAEINECMKVDETRLSIDINNGLQLHLPLNEIVENAAKEKEVVDVSTSKLNGKVNGATVVADSRFGNCINLDGVDDYIELPTTAMSEKDEITISFWANGDKSLPKSNSIISAEDKNSNRVLNIHLTWGDCQLHFDCGNQADSFDRISKIAEATDFKDQWTYWTFTKNVTAGEMNIYLNGSLWNSGTAKNKPLSPVTKAMFGCYIDRYFYHGKVAHLRIYDRVLSPEEINECMKVDGTPPPMDINRGLQLHLPLNEIIENPAKAKEVVDVSVEKLNGQVYGEPPVETDDRFGKCINFDGTNDYIELPIATIPETGEITISFWANGGKSLPNGNSIILAVDKSNHRVVNIHLPWSDSNVYFDCGNTTTSDDSYDRIYKKAKTADFKGKWTYWVFTKNVATGEMNIYFNGVLWQSGTGKEKPLSSITTVKFGSGYGFYNGKVAHLRIYDRVLSPEEINELMTVDEAGEAETTSTTDETDTTGETDTTSTTDETDTTGETDTTSTTDETDTTGETDTTSTTDETDTTGETDTTSTTDGTDAIGETDSTSTTDGTSKPIDINSGLHLNLPLNEIVENSAKEKEVVDASGGKLNGKVYGAKVITDPNFGDCISFDGVDDYIELPPTAIPEANEITISFWANGGESLPKQSSILLAEDKTNHRVVNIHLPWSDSNVCFDCGNKTTSFDRIEQLAQVSDFKGKWNHWAFTKNVATGEMKIYLNGSLWQTVTDKEQELSQITEIKLGCGYGFYEGKIADLRIYDRVLSQEEINELMKVNQPATTSMTGETDTTSTTDKTDTTQKPMEYRIYQVKGNPTIKTGYQESEWTAVIAGFNCGAKQKHKASAFTIMPVVEDGEWKIKCDIKDTDDRYWDVAVLFIRNNMVNRVNNFYR